MYYILHNPSIHLYKQRANPAAARPLAVILYSLHQRQRDRTQRADLSETIVHRIRI